MDRSELRATLEDLDPDDETGLIAAVQRRVRALSSRHLAIQDRIDDSESTRQGLEGRLAEAEAAIVDQADASVDQDVESIEDIEALPDGVSVEFDPELLREVQSIREQARSNYRRTAAEGADLQAELSDNSDELDVHQEVLAAMEADDSSVPEARERLLDFLAENVDESPGDVGESPGDADGDS